MRLINVLSIKDTFERLRNSLSQELTVVSLHVHFNKCKNLGPQCSELCGFDDSVQVLQEYLPVFKKIKILIITKTRFKKK